jgi:hypothetical protein
MTQYTINNLIPGQAYGIQIRSIIDGDYSEWSPLFPVTAQSTYAGTTPGTPTAPIVSAYLQQMKITWDGNFVGLPPIPADFDRIEVHMGSTPGFTISTTTQVRTLKQRGTIAITDLAAGTYYVRFRAANTYGTYGPESAESSATTKLITIPTIAPAAIADLTADPIFLQYFGASDGVSGWAQHAASAGTGTLAGWFAGSSDSANFEGLTVGGWNGTVAGLTASTVSNSSAQAHGGSRSLLITWPNATALNSAASIFVQQLIPTHVYEVTCWVFVPTGMPAVRLSDMFSDMGTGPHGTLPSISTTTNAWQQLGINVNAASTLGNTVHVDDFNVNELGLSALSWFNDGSAPTVPGVLRMNGPCWAEWQGSSPFAYDQQSFYRMRSRVKLTPRELALDGDFALGTNTRWDTFWGGTVTWDFTGNTGKATNTAGTNQNATLRNTGTNSNELPNYLTETTTIRISGRVRSSDPSATLYMEVLQSNTAGQAIYFGTGATTAASITIAPTTVWQNFTTDVVVTGRYYNVYLRANIATTFFVEWDDISIKEFSAKLQVGMIAYQSDRTTPIQPNNISTTKYNIHNPLVISGSEMGTDWYEFTTYIFDKSLDTAGITGFTPNQNNLELGTTVGWDFAAVNSTVTINTTQGRTLPNALQVSSTAAGAAYPQSQPSNVVVGKLYSAIGRVKAASVALTAGLRIDWYNSGASLITTTFGPTVTTSTSVWTDVVLTDAQAPVGAVTARVSAYFTATGAAQVQYWDDLDFIGDFSGKMGTAAKYAMSLSEKAKYWRPAFIFDPGSQSNDVLDVDWFQIDRVTSDFSIPGGLVASYVSVDTVTAATQIITDTLVYPKASAGYGKVLTSDDFGTADWQMAPVPTTVGAAPAAPRPGELWIDTSVGDFEEFFVNVRNTSATAHTPGTLTGSFAEQAGWSTWTIDFPCNGLLICDFAAFLKQSTANAFLAYTVDVKNSQGCTITQLVQNQGQARIVGGTSTAEARATGVGWWTITGVTDTASVEFSHRLAGTAASTCTARLIDCLFHFIPFGDTRYAKIEVSEA